MPKSNPTATSPEKSLSAYSQGELSNQEGFFKPPQNRHKKKLSYEERLCVAVLKKHYYQELETGLKEDLGEDYREDDLKICWENFIEKSRKNGLIKSILDDYLQEKIRSEREKFTGTSVPKTPM